jgi:hypothetical protein
MIKCAPVDLTRYEPSLHRFVYCPALKDVNYLQDRYIKLCSFLKRAMASHQSDAATSAVSSNGLSHSVPLCLTPRSGFSLAPGLSDPYPCHAMTDLSWSTRGVPATASILVGDDGVASASSTPCFLVFAITSCQSSTTGEGFRLGEGLPDPASVPHTSFLAAALEVGECAKPWD